MPILSVFKSTVLLLVLFVAEVILFAPENLEVKEDVSTQGEQTQDDHIEQALHGVYVVGAKKEQKEWELWADKAVDYKETEVMHLSKVRAVFFTIDGAEFKVTGKTGTVSGESMNMTVEGDVKMSSSNGYTFVTERLTYHSEDKKLVTKTPVQMRGPQERQGQRLKLNAKQLMASLLTNVMEVSQHVRGEKAFRGGKKVKIASEKALFSGKNNTAQFLEDVVVDYEAFRITGPKAQFDYDRRGRAVTSMSVDGGVRVSDVDKMATAKELKVDFLKNKFIFQGSPRVVQDNDELVGDQIIFLDGGQRVQVKKARAKVNRNRWEQNSE